MDGPPSACVICPVIELREGRLFGMSLKIVDREISEEHVRAARHRADVATQIAGVGLSRSQGYSRGKTGAPEAVARNRVR